MEKDCKQIIKLIIQELERLVAQNDLERASDLLWELVKTFDERKVNEVVVLKRGISELNQEHRLGKINFDAVSEARNRLADRLLGIAKSLFQYANRENAY